jgi:hypothetical protein
MERGGSIKKPPVPEEERAVFCESIQMPEYRVDGKTANPIYPT